jgi:chromosome segregation ATPase
MKAQAAAEQVLGQLPTASRQMSKLKGHLESSDANAALKEAGPLAEMLNEWDAGLEQSQAPEPARQHATRAAEAAGEIFKDLEDVSAKVRDASQQAAAGSAGQRLSGLAARQGQTAESLRKLMKGGQDASQAFDASETAKTLNSAEQDMRSAQSHLADKRPGEGIESQKAALEKLDQAQAEAARALEQMSANMQGSAAPMTARAGRPEGRYGRRTDLVKIPDASAFKVPEEFRDEIIKALSEGMPQPFQKENEKYYEELLK